MKQIYILLFIITSNQVFSQSLYLSTKLTTDRFMVGEKIELILEIEDVSSDIITQTDAFTLEADNRFVSHFFITPVKSGKLLLGPYFVDFNGQHLTSNELKLTIREKLKESEIRISCPGKAQAGEIVQIELTSTKESLSQVTIVESSDFKGKSFGSNSSVTYADGVLISNHKVRFQVVFDKKGDFEINEKWFANIPENLTLRSEKIKIR